MAPEIKYCCYCGNDLTRYSISSHRQCPYCNNFRITTNDVQGIYLDSLSKDFEILLLSGQFSDVKLVCSDDAKIPTHRNILSARSPVFRAIFENDMKESTSDIVRTGFDSDSVRKLLTFLYCGDLPRLEDYDENMLEASEYYQVDSLKMKCEDIMITRITNDNCLQYLAAADQFRSQKIMQTCLDFIKDSKNKEEIGNSKTLEKLHPDIMKTLFLYVSCGMKLSEIKSHTNIKK